MHFKTQILREILKKDVLRPDAPLTKAQQKRFDAALKRHLEGEPLSKIFGHKPFWKHDFLTTKDTLDPRPETELIIESVLKECHDPKSILDLGTGTGCILLSLLFEFPGAKGVGVDLCPKALKVARHNAKRLCLKDRSTFKQGDWLTGIKGFFDIITCNPPYIAKDDPNVHPSALYDPDLALFADDDGLACYKKILGNIALVMHDKSLVFLEVGIHQSDSVKDIAEKNGLTCCHIYKDLSGIERTLCFQHRSGHLFCDTL